MSCVGSSVLRTSDNAVSYDSSALIKFDEKNLAARKFTTKFSRFGLKSKILLTNF